MRKKIVFLFVLFLFIPCVFLSSLSNQQAYADNEKIYLGGMPAGFSLKTKGAYIVGLCDVITENGLKSPSKDAGLSVGDVIFTYDDKSGIKVKEGYFADLDTFIASDSTFDINKYDIEIKNDGDMRDLALLALDFVENEELHFDFYKNLEIDIFGNICYN